MTTIKTRLFDGQARILTSADNSGERVRCSCCEAGEGCCMYPASGYGTYYAYEDLPDEILVRPAVDGQFSAGVIASKQNANADYLYVSSPYNPAGGDLIIWEFRWISSNVGPRWIGRQRFTYQTLPVGVNDGSAGASECLIRAFNGVSIDGGFIEDNFEDTYTITASDPDPFFQGCSLIYRQELCIWYHPLEGCDVTTTFRGQIFYHDGTTPIYNQEAPHGWYYDFGQENFVRKSDPQNSPEGVYDLGFVSYTVSQ